MILHLDFSSEVPIYKQIIDEITWSIYTGQLRPGDELPGVRPLAKEIGVNFMTVNKAYQELKQHNLIISHRSRGTTVAESPRLKDPELKELKMIIASFSLSGLSHDEILEKVKQILKEENHDPI